jgi:cytochrome c oxidase cbb3-type subunit III
VSDPDRVVHEVDGIEEYDNQLPRWWLYTFYGSIAFAALYWYAYETGRFADGPQKVYEAEVERARAEAASRIKVGEATAESLTAMAQDPSAVALGKQVFASTCAACHRADGGGNVGPNLTDDYWLHGSAPDKIYKTIANGVPDKGMPAWLPQLGALKTQAVASYVLGLRGTSVPKGKAPQGERESLTRRD